MRKKGLFLGLAAGAFLMNQVCFAQFLQPVNLSSGSFPIAQGVNLDSFQPVTSCMVENVMIVPITSPITSEGDISQLEKPPEAQPTTLIVKETSGFPAIDKITAELPEGYRLSNTVGAINGWCISGTGGKIVATVDPDTGDITPIDENDPHYGSTKAAGSIDDDSAGSIHMADILADRFIISAVKSFADSVFKNTPASEPVPRSTETVVDIANFSSGNTSASEPIATPAPDEDWVHLDASFHYQEGSNNCGPAATKILLSHYGITKTESEIGQGMNAVSYVGDSRTYPEAIERYLGRFGSATYRKSPYMNMDSLQSVVESGNPAIAMTEIGYRQLHYVTVIGVDDENIYVHDPGTRYGSNMSRTKEDFIDEWYGNKTLYLR